MAAYGLNLNFIAFKNCWTETYYADFGVPFSGMYNVAKALALKRIVLSAAPVQIVSYSLHDPVSEGPQGRTIDFGPVLSAPPWPDAAGVISYGADAPAVSINIAFSNATEKRLRRIWMRGVPDVVVSQFGQLDSTQWGIWSQKFNAFRDTLLGLVNGQAGGTQYGWFARKRTADTRRPVTYSYVPGDIYPTFTVDQEDYFPETALKKKQYVRVSGLNGGDSVLNREMIVRLTSRSTFRPVKAIAAFPMEVGGSGFVQRYNDPEFVAADEIYVERAGKRSPGGGFFGQRGRSRERPRG